MTDTYLGIPWVAQQDCRSSKNEGIFDGTNPDRYGNENAWGIYAEGTRIAVLEEAHAGMTQDQVNKNAHILAASLEMLLALERMTSAVKHGNGLQAWNEIIRDADCAIAKARNEGT